MKGRLGQRRFAVHARAVEVTAFPETLNRASSEGEIADSSMAAGLCCVVWLLPCRGQETEAWPAMTGIACKA